MANLNNPDKELQKNCEDILKKIGFFNEAGQILKKKDMPNDMMIRFHNTVLSTRF